MERTTDVTATTQETRPAPAHTYAGRPCHACPDGRCRLTSATDDRPPHLCFNPWHFATGGPGAEGEKCPACGDTWKQLRGPGKAAMEALAAVDPGGPAGAWEAPPGLMGNDAARLAEMGWLPGPWKTGLWAPPFPAGLYEHVRPLEELRAIAAAAPPRPEIVPEVYEPEKRRSMEETLEAKRGREDAYFTNWKAGVQQDADRMRAKGRHDT